MIPVMKKQSPDLETGNLVSSKLATGVQESGMVRELSEHLDHLGQASKGARHYESEEGIPKGRRNKQHGVLPLLQVLLSGLSLGTILRKAISFTSWAEDFCRSMIGHFV